MGLAREHGARPMLRQLHEYLLIIREQVLPKSASGQAIAYTLKNWTALTRYCDDGDLAIDNNGTERSLRCFAVGRSNWTFFGSDSGGGTAAVLRSFVTTCELTKIDPFVWFRDVLSRIADHPMNRLDDLRLIAGHWHPGKTDFIHPSVRPSRPHSPEGFTEGLLLTGFRALSGVPLSRLYITGYNGLRALFHWCICATQMLIAPVLHSLNQGLQRFAGFRERVLDLRRNNRVDLANNDAIVLQFSQLCRKNARTKVRLESLYLVEPQNTMRHEVMQDDALPLAAYHFKAGFHCTSSTQIVGLVASLSHVTIQNVSMYSKCKYNKNMKLTRNPLHLIFAV
jgi:hypothetical protein